MIKWGSIDGSGARGAVVVTARRLKTMWHARQGGLAVCCVSCEASHVALAIGERLYRWCCVSCGWPSPWFHVTGGEVRTVGAVMDETPRGPRAEGM